MLLSQTSSRSEAQSGRDVDKGTYWICVFFSSNSGCKIWSDPLLLAVLRDFFPLFGVCRAKEGPEAQHPQAHPHLQTHIQLFTGIFLVSSCPCGHWWNSEGKLCQLFLNPFYTQLTGKSLPHYSTVACCSELDKFWGQAFF